MDTEDSYFPGSIWERSSPEATGFDAVRLDEAIAFAVAHETSAPRDLLLTHHQGFGREPFGDPVGPIKPRGAPTGIIVRHGRIVAEWGEPRRVDMTFSITKSFLSSVVGLAVDRGLIADLHRPVGDDVPPILAHDPAVRGHPLGLLCPFAGAHNQTITWDHLLRQTSDWEGVLWGKPDWADRPADDTANWTTRARHPAGTVYKYNDARTNLLALAALSAWRRPLPQVLKEHVMDPIGASGRWRWYGYDNSWVVLDGVAVQSVSGGGHWGGGMFIDAFDLARFGILTLRGGTWAGRRILSQRWIDAARTPTGPEPIYGFMNYFLNTDRKRWPGAPADGYAHIGNGTNMVYVHPGQDLVAVVRWIDTGAVDRFLQRLHAAIG